MAVSNLAILNEQLLQRPEPLREDLAGYILEHLDDLERDMGLPDDAVELSDELKQELDKRLAEYEKNPESGISWKELNKRLANSR